jgi:hypothetical protein
MSMRITRLPVLRGILPIDRSRVPMDIAAGVTLAALGIPEVMGYTKIAGMPVITGLYTILIPIAVFAVLGSSRHLGDPRRGSGRHGAGRFTAVRRVGRDARHDRRPSSPETGHDGRKSGASLRGPVTSARSGGRR